MRVFLSWSGGVSKSIATALRDWIPLVVPPARPWMSDLDVRAGEYWERQLSDTLDATDCGILVLTRDNHDAPWVVFEAGVLSRRARLGLLRALMPRESAGPPAGEATATASDMIASEVTKLADTLRSMDRYEREGGGASSEPWWDTLVANKKRAQSLYEQALALVNEAGQIKDRQRP